MPEQHEHPGSKSPAWLTRADQALVAVVLTLSLLAIAGSWVWQGGHRGELIEIDRAPPVEIAYVVDINAASWPELAQLPEIGETLARRIVESRETEGPFRDHDDLLRVRGIGPRTLDGIRAYLRPMPLSQTVAEK